MPTILITGGTGLLGRAVSKALVQRACKVIVLTRDPLRAKTSGDIRYAAWNPEKQEIDMAAIQEADHIIHLAGAGVVARKWTKEYRREIVESRTASSQLLVNALTNNSNRVQTVISASAIGWYGPDKDPAGAFIESDPPDDHFLGETCRLWEESIEPVTHLGKRLIKLRTGIVLSNEGGALPKFKMPVRFGIAAILGNGKQTVSWIHIDDLCRLFIHAIENESLRGTYNAVAPEPVSNKTLTLSLARAMRGRSFIPFQVPAFVLKIILGDRSIEVLKSTTVSCEKILATGFRFSYPDIETAIHSLVKPTDRH